MKIFSSLLVFAVLCTVNAKNVFVNNQKSDYVIVIPDGKAELVFPKGGDIKYAANFLNRYLEKSCGVKLPVVSEKDSGKYGKKLYLGATLFAKKNIADFQNLKPEELLIKIGKNDIIICGELDKDGIDRGTLFGVYEFCERFLKIRWYYPDDRFYSKGSGTIVPANPTVELPETLVRDYPRSIQREGVLFSRYYKVRKMEQLANDWHAATRDGSSKGFLTANHTQYFWAKMYWDSHPEYFAKDSKNVRKVTHFKSLCYTNEAVLQQMLKNIELYEKKPDKNLFGEVPPDKTHVYFCPNDGLLPHRFCSCPECAKLHTPKRPQGGYMSDYIFSYIKRYADAINKRWPGRRLAVLAYSYYQLPPLNVEIPDNVDVTLVFRNSMETQDKYDENIKLVDWWLKKLKNKPERLSFWFNICSCKNEPFGQMHAFQKFLKAMRDKGCRNEYFFCGFDPHTRYLPPVMSLLNYPQIYILNRLLWNPDRNIDDILKDFCDNMYGKASPVMYEFFQTMFSRSNGVSNHGGLPPSEFIYNVKYPAEVIDKLVGLLAKANSMTVKNSLENKRIADYTRWFRNAFIDNVKLYHDSKPDRIKRYFCYRIDKPVKIDGKLDDIGWNSIPAVELNHHAFGRKDPAVSGYFKMFRDEKNVYVGAVFKRDQKKAPLDMKKEELRIQHAIRIRDHVELYAPNIDKSWLDWYEYRISGDGKVILYTRRSRSGAPLKLNYECKVTHTADTATFEIAIPAQNFLVPKDVYLQIMRYWGVWDHFYTWSPMFNNEISHYSTKSFGLVAFPEKAVDVFTGLL